MRLDRWTSTEGTSVRTSLARPLLVLTTALALSACGNDTTPAEETPTSGSATAAPSDTSEASSPTASAEPAGAVVDITINGADVSPKGDRVEVDLGKPVTLKITSDRAGELHVHSTPEQEVSFEAGTTTRNLTFEQPGVVEVEDHESGAVIVQLQVS
jgi:hypothetical protein